MNNYPGSVIGNSHCTGRYEPLWGFFVGVCTVSLCIKKSVCLFVLYTFPYSYTFLSLCLSRPSDLGRFFGFLILYTASRTPWTGDQPVARPLPTHRTIQTQNKRKQTSMSRVGFEPTTPVFEPEKTVHALDRAATVIGHRCTYFD
jgi:hypothetical protein